MKKRMWYLSALALAAALTACGNKTEGQEPAGDGTPSFAADVEQELGVIPSAEADASTEVTEMLTLSELNVEDYMTMEDYIGLSLDVPDMEIITDEDVFELALNAYVNGMVNNGMTDAANGVTDRAVENGDWINLDYSGTKDGVAFDGGTAQGQALEIGSGNFISGFEDGLIGVMPGETVELNLTFPENYGNDLAGQAVVFTVTVNFIYPSLREEMSDEVMAYISEGGYETVDAFMDYCREYLEYYAKYDFDAAKEEAVMTALMDLAHFTEIPQGLINHYAENVRASLEDEAAGYGVDAETLCTYFYQMDSATYISMAAESSAQQSMIFQYIADKESLHISDEELDECLQNFVEENQLDSVESLWDAGALKEDFREYFMFEKVVDFVYDNRG